MTEDERAAYVRALPKELIVPTDDRLRTEAAAAADVLGSVWDGEVEVVVCIVRRGSNRVSWACTAMEQARLLRVLEEVRTSSKYARLVVRKGAPVKP